ncbi:MAG: AMP-binding protein [Desulfohalobiaceae bacterium]|nr:AMP-binding protein [Desulfohalobiaceae bacterium]
MSIPKNSSKVYDPELSKKYEEKGWWLGMTIGDILDKYAGLYPDKEALAGQGQRFTFAELRSAADRLAYGLLEQGFKKGDRVMLQLPNWPEFILAHYALQKAGLVMVLLTVDHTEREISHLAKLTEPTGWILPLRYRKTDYSSLIQGVTEQVPTLDKVIVVGQGETAEYFEFSDLADGNTDPQDIRKAIHQARPDPGDVCYLLPTGGTTNLPKCAVRTHNDYLCNVEYKSRAWDINIRDTSLVVTTVGHNLALLVTFSGAIFQGAKIVLLDSTRPVDFCRTVEEEKVTCTGLVPTLISRFVAYEELEKYDLSSLSKVYVGAAHSPPELVSRVERLIGCRYINAFGMVEGPCAQTRPSDPLEIRTETIGRPVCPHDDFCTLDAEGKKTPVGVEGELAAKGPGIFSGYYRNPQTNTFAFTPDGYFRTGDLAIIDQEGHIRLTGRIKDVINRGGEKISARDVEDIISTHPAVEYVAAVGMPDKDLGEQVCVFVKPISGATISHEDIVRQMEDYGAAKNLIPSLSEVVGSLPLTAAGKADKKILRLRLNELYKEKG